MSVAVIVVVSIPKFYTCRRLQEAEGYPHVDHWPGILVVVVFYPRPPTAAMTIFFPVAPSNPPSGRRKRNRIRRDRQGHHWPPQSPVRASERLPAVLGGIWG